jgi:hypothetical protein
VALIKGSLPLAAMVAGRTYQVTFTGTDARALNVVAKHSTTGPTQVALAYRSGAMTIDVAAITNIALSTLALTDPA